MQNIHLCMYNRKQLRSQQCKLGGVNASLFYLDVHYRSLHMFVLKSVMISLTCMQLV